MPRETDRYATIAAWYDTLTASVLAEPRNMVMELCRERGYRHVLDIGCGTGILARTLHGAGIQVACLDASPAMLARAAARLPSAVSRVQGGLPAPFADKSFDAAILALVMHESADEPAAFLAEALRVAHEAVVLEWRMPERNIDLVAQPLVHAIERLAGREHYARFRHFARQGYVHGAARAAGARVTHEQTLKAGTLVLAVVERV